MFKGYLKLSLILLFLFPVFTEGKSMLEDNFNHEERRLKSEKAALYWSIGGTVIPCVIGYIGEAFLHIDKSALLIVGGVFIGPSAGHLYAEQWGVGAKNIATRLGIAIGGGVLIGGIALSGGTGSGSEWGAYFVGIIGGCIIGGILVIHGLFDILSAPVSTRKYNESLLKKNSLRLIPEINPVEKKYRLSLVYSF